MYSYAETWGKLMNIPDRRAEELADLREDPDRAHRCGEVAEEQNTIDLYFRAGLIKQKLDAADIVDRSFADAIAKGAGL